MCRPQQCLAGRRIRLRRRQPEERLADQLPEVGIGGAAECVIAGGDQQVVRRVAGLFQDQDEIVRPVQRPIEHLRQ